MAKDNNVPQVQVDKSHEMIKLPLGSKIEQAVNKLLAYKEEGILASCSFNSVMLYSDTVTIDSAYKEITGMNKAEFDKHIGRDL